jgi:hypothetical protein
MILTRGCLRPALIVRPNFRRIQKFRLNDARKENLAATNSGNIIAAVGSTKNCLVGWVSPASLDSYPVVAWGTSCT